MNPQVPIPPFIAGLTGIPFYGVGDKALHIAQGKMEVRQLS